jgi:hypothetical protein
MTATTAAGTFLLCLLTSAAVYPQTPATSQTNGYYNGRWWRAQTESSKAGFLRGYATAADFVTIISNANDPTPTHALKVYTMCWPHALTFDEVIDSLDRFYAIPENGPIDLPGALMLAADRAAGISPTRIEERTLKMRAAASHAEDKSPRN